MQNTGSSKTAFKKQAGFLPMRLIRGLHICPCDLVFKVRLIIILHEMSIVRLTIYLPKTLSELPGAVWDQTVIITIKEGIY